MSSPKVSVVIPAYRRTECVLLLLRDLFAQEGVEFEVIVVDDCSPDKTADEIARAFPEVRLFVNEENSGPAVSRSRGIQEARGELIIGFDSDVSLPDTQLLKKACETFTRHPEVSGLAFRPLKPDGKEDDAPRWWHPVGIESFANRKFYTSYFSGTAYAFRRQAVLEAGLYPGLLYMHYEEVELAFRLLDQGGQILYCPHLTCLHHANPVSRRSEIKVFYKPRNQVLIALRNLPVLRGLAYVIPRVAYGLLTSVRGGHVKDFYRAMKSALKLAPSCLEERVVMKAATWQRIAEIKNGLEPVARP